MSIQLTCNGETVVLEDAATVTTLLDQLDLGGRRIAVELNGEIVPRSRHDHTPLGDDDIVLVVQAIGGG